MLAKTIQMYSLATATRMKYFLKEKNLYECLSNNIYNNNNNACSITLHLLLCNDIWLSRK